jgi:hypothetical protein
MQSQSQSQRPPLHHANLSRSLFHNPWTLTDTTLSTSTSTYWPAFSAGLNLSTISTFLTNPSISLVRVGNSEIHPHAPVKVVKPDWGHSTSTAASSEPNLRATWLGHAVRRSQPAAAQPVLTHQLSRVSSSSFRVPQQAQMKTRLASCSTPSSQTASALCHG